MALVEGGRSSAKPQPLPLLHLPRRCASTAGRMEERIPLKSSRIEPMNRGGFPANPKRPLIGNGLFPISGRFELAGGSWGGSLHINQWSSPSPRSSPHSFVAERRRKSAFPNRCRPCANFHHCIAPPGVGGRARNHLKQNGAALGFYGSMGFATGRNLSLAAPGSYRFARSVRMDID